MGSFDPIRALPKIGRKCSSPNKGWVRILMTCGTASGRLVARHKGPYLDPGKYTIVFDYKIAEPGLGKGGTGVLSVDGKEVATNTLEHGTPIMFPEDESFDVGLGTRICVAMVDTAQDASYFGTWANPTRLLILNYCEGDTALKVAGSPEESAAELRDINA